jgi:hypothetical protein
MNKLWVCTLAVATALMTAGVFYYFYEENRRAQERHDLSMKIQEYFYDQAVVQNLERGITDAG